MFFSFSPLFFLIFTACSLKDKSVTWKSSNTKIATVTVVQSKGSLTNEEDEIEMVTEINEIEEPAVIEPFDVYDLSGRKVLHQMTSLDGLPRGIYIVNGKKILKK